MEMFCFCLSHPWQDPEVYALPSPISLSQYLSLIHIWIPREKRLKEADKMLDLVKLTKHKKHMPNQMSGGQQQRVGVARALVDVYKRQVSH